MSGLRKKIITLIIFIGITFPVASQPILLGSEDLMLTARELLQLMYNYEFNKAREKLSIIQQKIPEHPASSFMEALIIYWEEYPLLPVNENSATFIKLMEKTMEKSEDMIKQNPDDLEAVFFSLFAKAFYSMFWADNGKPTKIIPLLPSMYRQTMKGMEKKDEFVEFYFTTGLYNYYIEAYPEKHPIYKPLVLPFRGGNRKEGLRQLLYCTENAVYLKVEAKYFMTLLFLGYENDPGRASELAGELYREFPNNICYMGNYAYTLVFDKKFPVAEVIIQNLFRNSDSFSRMMAHILNGYILEKYKKEYDSAMSEYETGLILTDQFGEMFSSFKTIALMGIGRHFKREGNHRMANMYFKQAKNISAYGYLTEDK